ncbi:LysM peptidoglycan-binding domain-containing protein [Priestia taiwanensis]|uniref:LysM domain-containing protein n=1 Tax=Priestia taiwanensis TaxID=1347902 RepID=A0A917ATU4_9BACI|nr:LysM peptidoglycan-binding domain-containing protein [Priestia taiwanensis]MBM7363630.1 morphogenetic protein associated with SpoVID [Priestia taiwanensis]GGE75452.1 hypothetical protein GCM10007140_26570 [Priestia taiwanensis]
MKIHIVQKGDTLWTIAKKYNVNFDEVKRLNAQLSNSEDVAPGMKVKVPVVSTSVRKARPETKQHVAQDAGRKLETSTEQGEERKEGGAGSLFKGLLPSFKVPSPAKTNVPTAPTPPDISATPFYTFDMDMKTEGEGHQGDINGKEQEEMAEKKSKASVPNMNPQVIPKTNMPTYEEPQVPYTPPVNMQMQPDSASTDSQAPQMTPFMGYPQTSNQQAPMQEQQMGYQQVPMQEQQPQMPNPQMGYQQVPPYMPYMPYPQVSPYMHAYGYGYGAPVGYGGYAPYPYYQPMMNPYDCGCVDGAMPYMPVAPPGAYFPQGGFPPQARMSPQDEYGSYAQQGGFPPEAYQQQGGFPPPEAYRQQGGFPPPEAYQQQGGFPPPEVYQQQGGFPPPEAYRQQGGFPPPEAYQQQGGFPPPEAYRQQGGFPSPEAYQQQGGFPPPEAYQQQGDFPPSEVYQQKGGFQETPQAAYPVRNEMSKEQYESDAYQASLPFQPNSPFHPSSVGVAQDNASYYREEEENSLFGPPIFDEDNH